MLVCFSVLKWFSPASIYDGGGLVLPKRSPETVLGVKHDQYISRPRGEYMNTCWKYEIFSCTLVLPRQMENGHAKSIYISTSNLFASAKHPKKKTPMISVTTPKIGVGRQKLATRSKNWHWLVCVFCVSDKNFTFTVLFIQPFENISSSCLNSFSLFSFAFLCIWRTPLWYKCHQPYTFHDIVRGHFRIYISVA